MKNTIFNMLNTFSMIFSHVKYNFLARMKIWT